MSRSPDCETILDEIKASELRTHARIDRLSEQVSQALSDNRVQDVKLDHLERRRSIPSDCPAPKRTGVAQATTIAGVVAGSVVGVIEAARALWGK